MRSRGRTLCWSRPLAAVAMAIAAVAHGSSLAQADTELVLLVDQERLVDDAALRKAILESAAQSSAAEVAALRDKEALPQLVARVYGYGVTKESRRYGAVQWDLVKAIAKLNNIEDINKIQAGLPLRLPLFIKRPLSKGSNPALAQVLNFTGQLPPRQRSRRRSRREPSCSSSATWL